jgi:hypothetical protein
MLFIFQLLTKRIWVNPYIGAKGGTGEGEIRGRGKKGKGKEGEGEEGKRREGEGMLCRSFFTPGSDFGRTPSTPLTLLSPSPFLTLPM